MHCEEELGRKDPSFLSMTVADADVVSKMAPTRVTVVEESLAEPKDFEEYKLTYENIVLVGAGTYGSVYYIKERESGDVAAAKYLRQVSTWRYS